MELREELIEKVERYLSGKLSREEVKEDNVSDLSNEEIDEAVDLFETSRDLIELNGLREDLQSIHEDYIAENTTATKEVSKKKGNSLRVWALLAIAATLVVISVFSGIFKSGGPQFDEYFEAYPNLISMRGDEISIAEAMRLYSSKDYEAALVEFSGIALDSMNEDLLFYQAISSMAVAKFELAVGNLRKLAALAKNQNQYWQQTNWYLGLALWQTGKVDEARSLLAGIKEGQYNYESALQLIDGL